MQCVVAPAGRYSARNVGGHAPPNASASGDPVSGMPRVLSDAIVTSSPDTHLTLTTTP